MLQCNPPLKLYLGKHAMQSLEKFYFPFFMALFMSGIMSFALTLLNLGLIDNLLIIWLKAWGVAFLVAFPSVAVLAPKVHKLCAALKSATSTD